MKYLRAAVLAAAVAVAPFAYAVDVDSFVRNDKFGEIKISPTGEFFAATVPLEDRTVLSIIRRSDNKLMTTFGLVEDTHVHEFNWSSPTRVVIGIAEQFGALDAPQSTGEIYAINADGTQAEMLVGFRVQGAGLGTKIQPKKVEEVFARIVDALPADDRRMVISVTPFARDAYSRAELLDTFSGRRLPITGAPVRNSDFLTDNAGVVRFSWGVGTDLTNKLFHRDGDGGKWTLINDDSQSGRIEIPIGFSADNRIAYLQVEQERGADRIVAWEPATGTRRDVLTGESVDPVEIIYRSGTGVPVGARFDDGRPRTRFFDDAAPEARLQKSLEAAFAGASVKITSQTADGRTALVHVTSDRNPGDYYLFDTTSKKADYLLSNRDWFDPDAMHPMEGVTFKARDGMTIHGYVTRPRTASAGERLPLVIMPHGGPFGIRDYWGFDPESQLLASAGYAVLQVNFRGSGGYGRSFRHAGARQWGLSMQDDISDATRWAVEKGIADGSKVCLYGASYGAYASLMGVAKESGLYKCAAGYVGVYDLPTMHVEGDISEARSGKTYVREWIGERDAVGSVSPTRLANRIKVPVFLAAGGQDRRAPVAHTKMMERALRAAGTPVETLYYDSEGHGFYKPEHRREFYTRLLAFLSRSIGGQVASAPRAKPAAAK